MNENDKDAKFYRATETVAFVKLDDIPHRLNAFERGDGPALCERLNLASRDLPALITERRTVQTAAVFSMIGAKFFACLLIACSFFPATA